MDDLIDRQQAIDAVTDELDVIDHVPQWVFDRLEKRLKQLPPAQPHTYRGVTLNDVMMYFDSLEGNEDAWTELCSCFECRGWELIRIQDGDARQDFLDIVYAELEDDPDNNRANEIIWAADWYAERRVDDALQVIEESQSAQLGTNLAEVGTRTVRGYPIDADALMEKVAEEYGERARDTLYRIIRDMPPVTPKQRTGKWIHISQAPDLVKGYWAKCSACGHGSFGGGKFCRECGAKMERSAE